MIRQHFYKDNLRFRDKILAFDYQLVFLILILGIISVFAMYSSEQGKFDYYTKNQIARFIVFFSLFIIIPLLNIKFWYSLTFPWTMIALEITIKPTTIVTAEINVTAKKTLFKTTVTLFK